MSSSISFDIFGIEQKSSACAYLREREPLIFHIFSIILEVELNVSVLIEEGAVVNGSIFLAVADEHEVQRRFLVFKEELDVLQTLGGEEKLLLVFVFGH